MSQQIYDANGVPVTQTDAVGSPDQQVANASGQIINPASETVLGDNVASKAVLMGGKDPNDKLAPLNTDNSGNLLISGTFVSELPADLSGTGTITLLNGAVSLAINGTSSAIFTITGTWTATIQLQGLAADNITWLPLTYATMPTSANSYTFGSNITANGSYRVQNTGAFKSLRAIATAYSAGTIGVSINASGGTSTIEAISPNPNNFKTAIVQNVIAATGNSSTANLNSGASFTGTSESTLGVAGIQINFIADQLCTVQCQQSIDGTNWDHIDSYQISASAGDSRTVQATASYFRILVTNNGASPTTYLRLQTALCPIVEAVPRALSAAGNFKVAEAEDMHSFWARQGRAFGVARSPHTLATKDVDNPMLYLVNGSANTKTVYIDNFRFIVPVSNATALFKLWLNPTVTVNGTAITIYNLRAGSAIASTINAYYTPTVTSNGNLVSLSFILNEAITHDVSFLIQLPPNNSLLVTGSPNAANTLAHFSARWIEPPAIGV